MLRAGQIYIGFLVSDRPEILRNLAGICTKGICTERRRRRDEKCDFRGAVGAAAENEETVILLSRKR